MPRLRRECVWLHTVHGLNGEPAPQRGVPAWLIGSLRDTLTRIVALAGLLSPFPQDSALIEDQDVFLAGETQTSPVPPDCATISQAPCTLGRSELLSNIILGRLIDCLYEVVSAGRLAGDQSQYDQSHC